MEGEIDEAVNFQVRLCGGEKFDENEDREVKGVGLVDFGRIRRWVEEALVRVSGHENRQTFGERCDVVGSCREFEGGLQ